MSEVYSALANFRRKERIFFERMEMSRSKEWRLPDQHSLLSIDGGPPQLAARSRLARIACGTAVISELYSEFDTSASGLANKPLWHFTLTDREFCVPASVWVPTECLPQMLRLQPTSWNTLGFFEPAYYYNLAAWSGSREPSFFWHAHGFLWGPSPKEVAKATKAINKQISAIGKKLAFVAKRVSVDSFPRQAAYIFKPPLREYMVWRPQRNENGKAEFLQRARMSGPANLVRSWCQLSERYLDELAFSSADGSDIHKRILERVGTPSIAI